MFRVIVLIALAGSAWILDCSGTELRHPIDTQPWDETINAWPSYERASKALVELPAGVDPADLKLCPSELSDQKRRLISKWLTDNTEAFEEFTSGTKKALYWRQSGRDDINHLRPIRYLAQGLLWRAKQVALDAGDMAQVQQDLLTSYRLSRHLRQSPLLIEHLVGVAILAMTSEASLAILLHIDADPAFVAPLRANLRREPEPDICDELRWIEGERLWAWGNIQKLFVGLDDDSSINWFDNLVLAFLVEDRTAHMAVFGLRRGQTFDDMSQGYAYAGDFFQLQPWEVREKGLEFWADFDARTDNNPLARWLMFNGPGIARIHGRIQADWAALPCCLAIWRYKHEMGHFPENLHTLVSEEFLDNVPIDPYSGRPLVYRATADGFTLYSIGEDFDDDGGRHCPWGKEPGDGDHVFWPVQQNAPKSD